MRISTPHRSKQVNGQYLLFYTSVALLACSLLVLALALRAEHRSTVRVAQAQTPFSLHQPVTMGAATTEVQSVSYSSGATSFSAPSGYRYLILSLVIRNNSDKPIQIIPSSDTYIKDPAGHVTYLTPFDLTNPFHAGELPAGERVSGQLSYLVPIHDSLRLYIDAIWSGGVLAFQLN